MILNHLNSLSERTPTSSVQPIPSTSPFLYCLCLLFSPIAAVAAQPKPPTWTTSSPSRRWDKNPDIQWKNIHPRRGQNHHHRSRQHITLHEIVSSKLKPTIVSSFISDERNGGNSSIFGNVLFLLLIFESQSPASPATTTSSELCWKLSRKNLS